MSFLRCDIDETVRVIEGVVYSHTELFKSSILEIWEGASFHLAGCC